MNKNLHPIKNISIPKEEAAPDDVFSEYYEYSAVYIYSIEPFELLDACDSKIRQDLTGTNNLRSLPENNREIIENATQDYSYDNKVQELKMFFQNTPESEWRDVLTLKLSNGQDKLFVASAKANSTDENGVVETIKVCLDLIPFDSSSIYELQKAVIRYNKSKYKNLVADLTKKELQVFKELVAGYSIVEIAEKFARSKYTIETHSARVKRKLYCKNLSEVVKIGFTS